MNDEPTFTVTTSEDAELCVQSFGDESAPALVLVGGATWSMDWWEDDLCRRIAARGRRVIRYDARDTGESTSYPVGAPGYTGADLAADVIAILDHLDIASAHLVGLSMGGGIVQRIALEHPERTASLTLIATTPVGPTGEGLPGPTARLQEVFTAEQPDPDWDDREAVISHIVDGARPLAGPETFDEEHVRALAGRVVDRTRDIRASLVNHFQAVDVPIADPRLERLAHVPTLVVHGTADPLFPVEHGRALVQVIPSARVLELAGMGHELPPHFVWSTVIHELVALTRDRGKQGPHA